MLLYKDIFTDKEVFTDSFKKELVDDLYYAVHGLYILEDCSIADSLIGANKSAEDETVAECEGKKLVPDIISATKLEMTPSVSSKKEYKLAIKKHITNLVKHVAEQDADRAAFLKTHLQAKFVMPMLKKFDTLQFYGCEGDEFDLEGGLIHFEQEVEYGSQKKGTKCTIYVLKDSVVEEKC